MRKELINYLCCLSCKEELVLIANNSNNDEIFSGSLQCKACKKIYSVLNGVPIFIDEDLSYKKKLTAQNFGYSWKRFSKANKDYYYKQFFDWINPINKDFLKRKLVLDAGCGKGHHLKMISEFITEGIGVDISDSVFVAYNNTKDLKNIHIIQADLNNLPLKDEVFDYIYSVGVIHHTDTPDLTTKNLYKKVKKNGSISIWVYGKENNQWIIFFIDPIRKFITRYFHPRIIYLLSILLTLILYPILKLIYLPLKKNEFLTPFRKKIFYYPYFSYISTFDFGEINNIIFDHLVAPTSHYLSKEEITKIGKLNNLTPQVSWHNENSWRIHISKN